MNEQEKQHSEAIIQEIYELRGLITECRKDARKLAEHVNRGIAGREVALAITKLQEADMWLHQAVIECMPKPPTTGHSDQEE